MDGHSDGTAGTDEPSGGRRVAAGVALLALLAALVLVAAGLLRDPLRLLAAALLVLVAVVAAWTALVRRGARRAAAAVVAVLALVGVVFLLVTGSPVRLVLIVALVLVATAAARAAIGHGVAPPPAARSVGPARHGVLILNRWSGGGKVERFDLESEAVRRGVTPIVLQRGDDLRVLAEHAIASGADVIGMAGGDGSQALVADVARRHDVAFVCVPAGTRNHFALDLGLDREDVAAALEAFGDARERRVDLALIGDRVFVNNASLGAYATVVQSADYRDAKLATTARVLPDLLGPDAAGFDLRFTPPDGATVASADILLVSNGVYHLGSLGGFGTRERLDAGVLGVVSVAVDRARDIPMLLSAEAAGHVERFHGYRGWSVPEFEVDSAEPLLDVGVDGEALRLPPPLVFRSLPGALRVRTPPRVSGPASARPHGAGAAVTALFRVLGGSSAR